MLSQLEGPTALTNSCSREDVEHRLEKTGLDLFINYLPNFPVLTTSDFETNRPTDPPSTTSRDFVMYYFPRQGWMSPS
jgi:hypothetical protein